jgi:hypothetical protein
MGRFCRAEKDMISTGKMQDVKYRERISRLGAGIVAPPSIDGSSAGK